MHVTTLVLGIIAGLFGSLLVFLARALARMWLYEGQVIPGGHGSASLDEGSADG